MAEINPANRESSKFEKRLSGSSTSSSVSGQSGLFLTLPNNFSPGGGTGGTGANNASHHQSGSKRASPVQSHHHAHHHTSTPDDLRRLFLVSLEKLSRLEPESLPFRQPVDPLALGIPDYLDIIRRPMDLHTIRGKMNGAKYTEPYQYIDDVLRMLDNAWVYNRENSKVYNYALRLAQVFVAEVNPVMGHLGHRKGRSNAFQFNSDVISCHGRPVCIVFKGQGYWKGNGVGLEFNLCEECYGELEQKGQIVVPDLIAETASNSSSPPFLFTINNSKVYSPAAELKKSHLRDAEMSRQLVLREFLRMLVEGESNDNVWKMLGRNRKLCGEFGEYLRRGRGRLDYGDLEVDGVLKKLERLSVVEEREGRGDGQEGSGGGGECKGVRAGSSADGQVTDESLDEETDKSI